MSSTNYFTKKYSHCSDEELFEAILNSDGYSGIAKEALESAITKRGGLLKIGAHAPADKIVVAEIKRIKIEARKLSCKETNTEFLKTLLSSSIISKERVDKLIRTVCVF